MSAGGLSLVWNNYSRLHHNSQRIVNSVAEVQELIRAITCLSSCFLQCNLNIFIIPALRGCQHDVVLAGKNLTATLLRERSMHVWLEQLSMNKSMCLLGSFILLFTSQSQSLKILAVIQAFLLNLQCTGSWLISIPINALSLFAFPKVSVSRL